MVTGLSNEKKNLVRINLRKLQQTEEQKMKRTKMNSLHNDVEEDTHTHLSRVFESFRHHFPRAC